MDPEQADQHPAFGRSRERFLRLVELLKSNQAMGLSLPGLEALVEPAFQGLMAQMRQEYLDQQAKRASGAESASGTNPGAGGAG